MKKNFLRILPIAAAVLLATSCSKDNDDNTIVENNAAQEKVEAVHDFALTVSNGESLSKLSLADELGGNETKALKYDIGDKLYIALKDEEDGAPDFFESKPLTDADISVDGTEATFHFPQPECAGKTPADVREGFMGANGDDDPDEPFYTFSAGEDTDPLTRALSFAKRDLDVSSWTLKESSYHCVIYLDPNTEKEVELTYYAYDHVTEEDVPETITLEAGYAYVIGLYQGVAVTVEGASKSLVAGKLYYVTE